MSRLGFVTGMQAEAACLASLNSNESTVARSIYCAGGNPGRAESGAVRLIEDGAKTLISFGIAGGLAPSLKTGDILVAETVVCPKGLEHRSDPALVSRISFCLEHAGLSFTPGRIATVESAVATSKSKEALHRQMDADAVDMESSGCAAAAHGRVPFAAIRVIADPSECRLPTSALRGLTEDGRARPLAVLMAAMRKPWEIGGLIRVGRDSRAALKVLRRVAALDLRLLLSV